MMTNREANILIGVTGSVATIKLPIIVNSLRRMSREFRIKVITTERAKHFFSTKELLEGENSQFSCSDLCDDVSNSQHNAEPTTPEGTTLLNKSEESDKSSDCIALEVLSDDNEWSSWEKIGDPVLHVELCKWADIFVIAPLDANTLGKLANGLCDNLLTCTFRAWDVGKPIVFCPAMNTRMWTHPMTEEHISKLVSWGHTLVPPISKKLACGDEGTGAMAEVLTIVEIISSILKHRK